MPILSQYEKMIAYPSCDSGRYLRLYSMKLKVPPCLTDQQYNTRILHDDYVIFAFRQCLIGHWRKDVALAG